MSIPVFSTPWDARLDPVDLAGPDRMVWSHGGRGFAAWGEYARVEIAPGPDRIDRAARDLADLFATLEDPEGAIAFGSFTFDPETEGSVLVIPAVVVHCTGDSARIVSVGTEMSPASVVFPPRHGSRRRIRYAGSTVADHRWLSSVAHAVALIGQERLDKVVLARDVKVWSEDGFDTGELARNLAVTFPDCYTYVVDGLVGASPELLIERRGSSIRSRVLAGTAGRGRDPAQDHDRAQKLMTSAKEASEHRLAVESVARVLAPLCDPLEVSGPELLVLANVQHLATTLTGRVAGPPPTALELSGRLHPTAAVGGDPPAPALAAIRALEGMSRDRYAAPVGWVDHKGDGQWAVALRCGIFREGSGRLFAGAGIVAGSDPADELEETRLKLRAIQSALEGADVERGNGSAAADEGGHQVAGTRSVR